jgi:hypothetical protein
MIGSRLNELDINRKNEEEKNSLEKTCNYE